MFTPHLTFFVVVALPLVVCAFPSSQWLGNRAWTRAMKWAGQAAFGAAPVTDWKVGGKAAGTLQTASNFSFLRVYDAGHMVPRDQPAHALAMVNSFMAGGL